MLHIGAHARVCAGVSGVAPDRWSSRCIVIVWFFECLFITISFTANLTATVLSASHSVVFGWVGCFSTVLYMPSLCSGPDPPDLHRGHLPAALQQPRPQLGHRRRQQHRLVLLAPDDACQPAALQLVQPKRHQLLAGGAVRAERFHLRALLRRPHERLPGVQLLLRHPRREHHHRYAHIYINLALSTRMFQYCSIAHNCGFPN